MDPAVVIMIDVPETKRKFRFSYLTEKKSVYMMTGKSIYMQGGSTMPSLSYVCHRREILTTAEDSLYGLAHIHAW